jgi:AcrR family transcriptional regulator
MAKPKPGARTSRRRVGDSEVVSRRDLVADRIVEQAAQLFADHGFSGTSFGDIADALQITRPAIYHYFTSKEQLLEHAVEGLTVDFVRLLKRIRADRDLTTGEKLTAVVTGLVERVAGKPAHMRLLAASGNSFPPGLARAETRRRREALSEVEAIVETGVHAGELRHVDARLAALMLFGMCNWMAWWYDPDGPATPHQIAAEATGILLHGLSSPAPTHSGGDIRHAAKLLRADLDYLELLIPPLEDE